MEFSSYIFRIFDKKKMQFKIGDIVQFVDEEGKGTVVEIIDKTHVKIEDENGFSYPVDARGLMPVSTVNSVEENFEKEEDTVAQRIEKTPKEKAFLVPLKRKKNQFSAISLILAFAPVDEDILNTDLDVFLINDSNYDLFFQCSANIENHYQKIFSGQLEANTQIHLTTIRRDVLPRISDFLFHGLIVLESFQKPFPPIDKIIKLKHQKFQKPNAFKPSEYFDEVTIEYTIFHSDFFTETAKITSSEIEKQIAVKNENAVKKQSARRRDNDLVEVDLHIHEIIDNTIGLSNSEILTIQLNHFQKELEHALATNVNRIVFIHGKGKGVLKNAVLEKLRKEYPHLQYQDASFKEYGFGATMVFLR